MKLEDFLKEGIVSFNEGPKKVSLIRFLKLSFVIFPFGVITLPFRIYTGGKKTSSLLSRLLLLFLWVTMFAVVFYWIDDNLEASSAMKYLLVLLAVYIILVYISMMISMQTYIHMDARMERKLKKEYREAYPGGLKFSSYEYTEAADLLRKLKPEHYSKIITKHPKKIIDLLLLSGGAMILTGKVRRMVSVKAIEEEDESKREHPSSLDREAG